MTTETFWTLIGVLGGLMCLGTGTVIVLVLVSEIRAALRSRRRRGREPVYLTCHGRRMRPPVRNTQRWS